ERRADEATRDAVDWLKCEFVMSEIGKEFDGIITGVTSFGLFVELDDIYVQGLVHVTTLGDDYYQFDPVKHMLYGERSGVTFRLADKIRVKVVRVDLDERSIDFVLAEPGPARKGATRAGGKGRARAKKSRSRSS
ncbi:MAG: S1 RNA-binding domain-containing protein, partial [Gammaproteobacteria bacterium]|nr:S1 RNA-binding domain-containing protein [Gammaproteobacteria bacterium]